MKRSLRNGKNRLLQNREGSLQMFSVFSQPGLAGFFLFRSQSDKEPVPEVEGNE